MRSPHLLSFTVLSLLWRVQAQKLDLAELEKSQYEVVIQGRPKIHSELDMKEDSLVMSMRSRFGQQYACTLPTDPEHSESSSESSSTSNMSEVASSLSALRTGPCLIRIKDWWTYELCPMRDVKQYHLDERTGKVAGVVVNLGYFEADFEWNNTDSSEKGSKASKEWPAFHSQLYVNGSQCDLTGRPRSTEVRYYCEPGLSHEVVSHVEEPRSCEYVVSVLTPKLCRFDHLRPPRPQEPLRIECTPIIEESQKIRLEQIEKEAEVTRLKKERNAKEAKRQRMIEMLQHKDISHIDVNSDEGYAELESMVESQLAERLVGELASIIQSGENTDSSLLSLKHLFQPPNHVPLGNKKTQFQQLVSDVMLKKRQKKVMERLAEQEREFEAIAEKQADLEKREEEHEQKGEKQEMKAEGQKGKQEDAPQTDARLGEEERQDLSVSDNDEALGHEHGEREHFKHDGKRSVKKELRDEEYSGNDEENSVGDADVSTSTTLAERLESTVNARLKSLSLTVGGQVIEVKLISSNGAADLFDLEQEQQDMHPEEAHQYQNMIQNLMMGNHKAYAEIDGQRQSERNYRLSINDLLKNEESGELQQPKKSEQQTNQNEG